MWTTLLLSAFLAFSSFAHSAGADVCSYNVKSYNLGRIVNGTKAIPRQFPHQVSLRRSWSKGHFCGGSIISTNLVLTAAHCMCSDGAAIQPWTIIVVGGALKLDETSLTRQERGVENIRIHPEFKLQTLQNDIAVLQLSVPFNFIPELRNAPLPGSDLVPNTVCQVSGWGYPDQGTPTVSNDLMYVDLPVRSTEECRKLLVNVTDLPEGMFCAGWLEGGRDACQGDSGGGMVCNGILTGVVSGGEGCALPQLPGVYADVFYYLNWISEDKNVILVRNYSTESCTNNSTQNKTPTITIVTLSLFFVLLSIVS